LDEPGTATADTGGEPDAVEEVGLERAPATERDVAGVVVVIDDFAGATLLDVAEFRTGVSLLCT
jgi:hypothetical protein